MFQRFAYILGDCDMGNTGICQTLWPKNVVTDVHFFQTSYRYLYCPVLVKSQNHPDIVPMSSLQKSLKTLKAGFKLIHIWQMSCPQLLTSSLICEDDVTNDDYQVNKN